MRSRRVRRSAPRHQEHRIPGRSNSRRNQDRKQRGLIAGLIPAAFGRLRRQHQGIAVHVKPVAILEQQHHELRERKVDLVVGRVAPSTDDDVAADVLFQERTFVVAGLRSKWARRRKIELAELADEPWSLPSPDTLIGSLVADAFRRSGMRFPPKGAAMGTLHLFSALVASEPFLAIVPGSLLRFGALPPLKVLPVNPPIPAWPVGVMTLKNRTLTPVVRLFIDCVRAVSGRSQATNRPSAAERCWTLHLRHLHGREREQLLDC